MSLASFRSRRAAARRRGQSGAAAVEFALVFPVILLLTFAIIEFAFLLRDYVGASQAVRDAVRVASVGAQQGGTGTQADIVAGHRGTGTPSFAFDASQAVTGGSTAVPSDRIVDMWVFLANRRGYPSASLANWRTDTNSAFTNGFCVANETTCVRYAFEEDPVDPSLSTFDYRRGIWDPATINACSGSDDAMAVGVYIRIRHTGPFAALFGTEFTVSDSAVLKFEPLRNIRCSGSLP